MKRLLLAASVLFGLPGVAFAQCTGPGGVPFNCATDPGTPQPGDVIMGGSLVQKGLGGGKGSVGWTLTQFMGAGTVPGLFTTLGASAKTSLAASTVGSAGFNLAPGTAPTSPVNGDLWTTSSSIFVRVNGATHDLLAGGGTTWPTSGYVVISNGTSSPGGVAPSGTSCLVSSGGSWGAGSCSGSGGISGPGSSTVGFIPTWSNTGGTALAAGVSLAGLGAIGVNAEAASTSGVFDNTAMHDPFTFLTNGLSPLTVYQLTHASNFATLGLVVGVALPNTSTGYEADAIAGYITNSSTTTGAAAGSFYALNLVAGAVSWALNPLVDDQGHASTVVGAEFDIGSSNTASNAYGINMIGVFPSGTPTTAVAYQASILNAPWQYVLVSYDGTSTGYAFIGSQGTGANSNGQTFTFNTRDNSNTVRQCLLQALHQTSSAELFSSCPVVVGSNVLITGGLVVQALATTCSGAVSGTFWNNAGAVNVCP